MQKGTGIRMIRASKKALAALLALTFALTGLGSVALAAQQPDSQTADAVVGASRDYRDGYWYTLEDGNATIVMPYEGGESDPVVPETLDGYPVVHMLSSVFSWRTDIHSVTLPASLRTLGDGAFSGCSALTSIDVQPGNTFFSAQDGALYDAAKTTLLCYPAAKEGVALTLPATVTAIGNNACWNGRFASVDLPQGLSAIGAAAFYGCANLTAIDLPAGVTSLGMSAFERCTALTQLNLGNVEDIGESAFNSCTALTAVTLPEGVRVLGTSAFAGCAALEVVTLPASLRRIGEGAFVACSALTSISVASGSTYYCTLDGVLYDAAKTTLVCHPAAKAVTEYTPPQSLLLIDSMAFDGCTRLVKLSIHNKLLGIGHLAFRNCPALTDIYFYGNAPQVAQDAFNLEYGQTNAGLTLHYLTGTTGWSTPTFAGTPCAVFENPAQPGDVLGNGKVTPFAALLTLQMALGTFADPQPWQLVAADMDGNGSITSLDALRVLRLAVG